jgi:hypothetical protein
MLLLHLRMHMKADLSKRSAGVPFEPVEACGRIDEHQPLYQSRVKQCHAEREATTETLPDERHGWRWGERLDRCLVVIRADCVGDALAPSPVGGQPANQLGRS